MAQENPPAGEVSEIEKSSVPPWIYHGLPTNKYSFHLGKFAHTLDTNGYAFFGRTISGSQPPLLFEESTIAKNADAGYYGRASGIGQSIFEDGSVRVPLIERPVLPLTSMMQLQHSGLGGYRVNPVYPASGILWNQAGRSYLSFPYVANAFGNSFNSPYFSDSEMERRGASDIVGRIQNGSWDVLLHDKSWKLNAVLWDSWFMSGVGDWENYVDSSVPSLSAVEMVENIVDISDGSEDLPNKRHRSSVVDQEEAESDLIDGGKVSAEAYQKIARYLENRGQFNVNSTSETAWKLVLAGADLTTRDVLYLKPSSTPGSPLSMEWQLESSAGESVYSFSRFRVPMGESVRTEDVVSKRNQRWLGVRALNESELESLAEKMVEQVKLRGPFLSLGEFMNRGLKSSGEGRSLRYVKGAAQAAIDNAGLNDAVRADSKPVDSSTFIGPAKGSQEFQNVDAFGHYDAEGNPMRGSMIKGAPGYLTQADLFMGVAPSLSVRCDTFTIRAYGESRDSAGKVMAQSWCEAVVRRFPEYVVDEASGGDSATVSMLNPDGTLSSLKSSKNDQYGRKLKIISFKYLNPNEV
ncbi:hypothetical protein [Rubritalea tangerina]|uniref:Uncharacterized protein n=1 Tax=Rubritalea tangerina TaxID=430798 RepID=A0ABW4ZEC9_9BACT